jgi:putative membrane protein
VPLILLICVGLITLITFIHPKDLFTWFLEAAPVLIAAPILIGSYKRFRFSNFAYFIMALHAIVLLVGAHYTYAEVPLFNWIRDHWHLSRNHYDRIGHLMQGFGPAIVGREILLRNSPLKGSRWLPFLVLCVCMTISAVYELVEWATALISGTAAEAFLGTQGDVWDTQTDMFMALIGATLALLLFKKIHDKSIKDSLASS